MKSCKICGLYETDSSGNPHNCYEKFQVVWGEYVDPKNIDWNEASEVLAFHSLAAVEKYAEDKDEDRSFIDDRVEVFVKDSKGNVTYWDVSASVSINYRANKKDVPN